MSALLHPDRVVANGNADGECAVLSRLDHVSFACAEVAVDVELYALHRIVGAGIHDFSAYWERRHVFEVDAAMVERRHADVARQIGRRELVDAQRGDDGVVGAVARERHAAHHVVAFLVGVAH